jgi:hypothetical protein
MRSHVLHTHMYIYIYPDSVPPQSLPPTYEAHLDGLPGFTATVDYSVTAIASKTKNIKLGIGVTCVSLSLSLSLSLYLSISVLSRPLLCPLPC